MKSPIKIIVSLFVVILFLSSCSTDTKEKVKNSKPMVALTTFALYDITKHIAQDSVKIINILPLGVDPHSYEPTPRLIANIEKSALVVYSGVGLEPWTQGFSFTNRAINVSKYVDLRELSEVEIHEHSTEHKHENIHHDETAIHGAQDPHYWLNFSNMQKITELITQELIKIAPNNKKVYLQNRDAYIIMLKNLDEKYKKALLSCKRDTIVVNHNAFGYLSEKYGFEVESLNGLSPDAQANAKNIIRLIHIIKEHNISTLFFESFASDRAIKSIADETNVAVDVLQPLGNITADEAKQHLTYEAMMLKNLEKLSKALACR